MKKAAIDHLLSEMCINGKGLPQSAAIGERDVICCQRRRGKKTCVMLSRHEKIVGFTWTEESWPIRFSARGICTRKQMQKKKKNKNSCRWTDEMPRGRVAFRRPVVRQMGLKCRAWTLFMYCLEMVFIFCFVVINLRLTKTCSTLSSGKHYHTRYVCTASSYPRFDSLGLFFLRTYWA